MKVAVTSSDKDIDAEIDPRFGRAKYFLLVDTETLAFDVVENTQNLDLPQGAGIQAGKNLVESGAGALITGNCGPKAFRVLESAKIDVFVGIKGTVREAVEKFKAGELAAASGANVEGHWV